AILVHLDADERGGDHRAKCADETELKPGEELHQALCLCMPARAIRDVTASIRGWPLMPEIDGSDDIRFHCPLMRWVRIRECCFCQERKNG
ncbi:hypothetical protein BaRGS_00014537, partial [Batillaria attramentaria]